MAIVRSRKHVAGLAVVALLVMAGADVVLAHSFRAASSLTIGYSGGAFTGDVESGRPKCERGRTVTVYKQRAENIVVVGSDETGRSGGYRVPRADPDGSFFAKVSRRVGGRYRHSHVCRGARSGTIDV